MITLSFPTKQSPSHMLFSICNEIWSFQWQCNKRALTPQSGTEAVPAWGPPRDIRFLTCFFKNNYACLKKKLYSWGPLWLFDIKQRSMSSSIRQAMIEIRIYKN